MFSPGKWVAVGIHGARAYVYAYMYYVCLYLVGRGGRVVEAGGEGERIPNRHHAQRGDRRGARSHDLETVSSTWGSISRPGDHDLS